MTSPPVSIPEAYERLLSLLAKCPQTIEILPGDDGTIVQGLTSDPSFAPFLFVEGNLGAPEKVLQKVYLHAVSIFKTARSVIPTRPTPTIQQNPSVDPSLLRMLAASSAVLLLVNPTYQTALNARKHLVRMRQIEPHAELRFIAFLLSSQHAARQSEFWHHRRWLLGGAYEPHPSGTADADPSCRLHFTSQAALQQELELVSRACEVYPRNYFAWAHRLICIRSLLSAYLAGSDSLGFATILRNEFVHIKEWIDRHLSDYTAIHTILTLSWITFQSEDAALIQMIVEEDLLNHAISLVQEYPTHEALWMYVRTALVIPVTRQERRVQRFVDHFVQPLIHLQHPKISREEDLIQASQYAKQFMDRKAGERPADVRFTCS